MSSHRKCCLLGVCCVRKAQTAYITNGLVTDQGLAEADASKAADWFANQIADLGDLEKAVAAMKKAQKGKPLQEE